MKHFKKIMTEMAYLVGAEWEDINPKEKDWFKKHSWDSETQQVFRNWFVKYLMDNEEAREEILNINVNNQVLIERAVDNFIFNYGWTVKE